MADSLESQISVEESGPDEFTSRFNPRRMGNALNIAYGGCTIGVAIQSAASTVSSKYHLYSVLGNYLGPALTDRKLVCSVRRVRDTRTFATRLVELSQVQNDGARRLCMVVLADFQVEEEASLLTYSAPPTRSYSPPQKCLPATEVGDELVKKGVVPMEIARLHKVQFGLMLQLFDARLTPEGLSTNNLNGMAKEAPTDQDGLPITSKASAGWLRCRHALQREQDHFAGLGFLMDGELSFIPLTHSGMFLDDAGACSTLDFALRFFTTKPNLNNWHLRELKTATGGGGRTYSESRLWDLSGKMIASMTQQSILRPIKRERAAL